MIVSTKDLLKQAYGKYAVGAYNINNAEQIMGLFKGCMESKAPFIIQTLMSARDYINKTMLEGMIKAADEIFPEAVFAVHLDHGDEKTCYECIDSGFYTSVMVDASYLPFEENVAITKRVVNKAHEKGVAVEAELGQLGGGVEGENSVEESKAKLTDPKQAAEFRERTGVDSLACAIGTSHGAFKFSGEQGLHFEVIEEIAKLCPGFPLVIHGASSVPQDEIKRINDAGGKIKGAKGCDVKEYLPAAKRGVAKINIYTDGILVWTRVHREFFRDKPEVFDFRPMGKVFMEEYAKFVVERNILLGSAGELDKVKEFLNN